MRRRDFITAIGGSAAIWPLAAHGQEPPIPVIGFLGSGTSGGFKDRVDAFRRGLQDSGYVEGRNVAIEYRWAAGDYGRLQPLAAELARHRVAIFVTCANV